MQGLQGMSQMITEVEIEQIWVDGPDVITWYELHTNVAEPAPTANWSRVEDGKITAIRATFDARPFTEARSDADSSRRRDGIGRRAHRRRGGRGRPRSGAHRAFDRSGRDHGRRLDEALAGVDAVIDVMKMAELDAQRAREFFGTVSANLLAAEARARVAHHVLLSIVGIDRVEGNGHYAGKCARRRSSRRARCRTRSCEPRSSSNSPRWWPGGPAPAIRYGLRRCCCSRWLPATSHGHWPRRRPAYRWVASNSPVRRPTTSWT